LRLNRRALVSKRAMDVCGSAVFLMVSAPIIFVLACIVKVSDRGPAFYRRRVVGRKGDFDAFKLRSMRVDADEILWRDPSLARQFSVNFKLRDDPRVTALGAAMRRLSIDELPQLWNVLRGEMSLVGPRMISPPELGKFGEHAWIFSVAKPGLTGYWQTERSPQGSYEERVRMEIEYVENWSLVQDFKILMRTPWRVLRGAGAC
jgi:exopolysaccharide production protein ExoY